jgi:adenylate cyclase
LVDMLNNYLDYMSNIILSFDGTIDKYIGDAIMAIWNAPLDDPDHATKAIQAAMAMEIQVQEFAKSNPEYPEIKIGIGLNSGLMTVGNLGGSARFDYTVIGDNVNLGARLEGLTKKYDATVICTEDTANQYHGEEYLFRLLDDVTVKGKSQSVKIMQPMQNNQANQKIAHQYQKAFATYQQGNFKAAKQQLESILKIDKPSHKLLERVEHLIQNPPQDWNGVWNWEEK